MHAVNFLAPQTAAEKEMMSLGERYDSTQPQSSHEWLFQSSVLTHHFCAGD